MMLLLLTLLKILTRFAMSRKETYLNSGRDFLQKYASQYSFLETVYRKCQFYSINYGVNFSDIYQQRDYSNYTSHSNSFIAMPLMPRDRGYHHWYPLLNSTICKRDESCIATGVEYNDRFRLSSIPHHRFLSIHFLNDPWEHLHSWIIFSIRVKSSRISRLFCNFSLIAHSAADSATEIEFNNEVYRCKIPVSIITTLRSSSLDYMPLNVSDSKGEIILRDVRVPRLHELDRRTFNVSITSMINDVSCPLLVEWLVYHILLGVEHFYLFDNRKIYLPRNASAAAERRLAIDNLLRPFLDANLVTLVYFPFVPLGDKGWQHHWNSVQKSYFQSVLHQFGPYNRWLGVFDMDEFFFPVGVDAKAWTMMARTNNPLATFLDQLDAVLNKPKPNLKRKRTGPGAGIMFNALDSQCVETVRSSTSKKSLSYTPVTLCRQVNGTLHFKVHSKAFVKPGNVPYILNPHDIPGVLRGLNHRGIFRHYNNFRYSDNSKWKIAALNNNKDNAVANQSWTNSLLDKSFSDFSRDLLNANFINSCFH